MSTELLNGTLFVTSFSSISELTTPATRIWTYPAVSSLLIAVFVILFNGITLTALLTTAELRSQPFNTYLMSLMSFNLLYALLQNPFEIINYVYSSWWLGPRWCLLYIYAQYIFVAGGMHSHVLISISRLWAMTFPWSYRRFHSRRLAVCLCLGMFVYVNALVLPSIVEQLQVFEKPLETAGCLSQFVDPFAVQLLAYIGTETVVLLSYPFILYKRKQRQKVKMGPTESKSQPSKTGKHEIDGANDEGNGNNGGQTLSNAPPSVRPTVQFKSNDGSHGFMVLTLLTANVFILWTPATVAFTIASYLHVRNDSILFVTLTMFTIVPVLDPILLNLAMPSLRTAIRRTFWRA